MNDKDRVPRKSSSGSLGSSRSIEARVHAVGSSGLKTISIRGFRLSSGEGDHVAGFDLGPGPDEHFLGALGASLAQSVSTLCCSRGLPVDRIDVTVGASMTTEALTGDFIGIHADVRIESASQSTEFEGVASAVLAHSAIANAIRIPIDVRWNIVPLDPDRLDAVDWQI
jgi:organic hydroperoxide reductase OsmC/OhrA